MNKQFTLGRNERLKSRKQIEKLFAEGKTFVVTPFRVHHLLQVLPMAISTSVIKGRSPLQFGVGISAKNFKRAIDRNRIKRLVREAWRLQNTDLKIKMTGSGRQLNVFFVYNGKELPDFKTVKDKVAVVLRKLGEKIDENASANT